MLTRQASEQKQKKRVSQTMTAKEIAIELLYRARREGLPQTQGQFYRKINGERSYCALGAIHHYLFNDDNRIRWSIYTNDELESVLGKQLCQKIYTLNDSESTRGHYRFDEIAEKIKNEFH
jgi:hypothetical protein